MGGGRGVGGELLIILLGVTAGLLRVRMEASKKDQTEGRAQES